MKRFINDVKKFFNYSSYNVKAELKSEVAGSFLSWLWWILDPLLYMVVYAFVASVIFNNKGTPAFLAFVFIGLNCWQFFNRVVRNSVKLVSNKKSIVTKVYIPKYMFVFEKIGTNGFKMLVSFIITVLFMIYYYLQGEIVISLNMLWLFPLLIMLGIISFAFSVIVMHFGVFVEDLLNVVTVGLQLVFYLSGIFYDIGRSLSKHPNLKDLLYYGNPVALIITNIRNTLLYGMTPDFFALGIWLAVCLVISIVGVKIIYKYENSYVKII
mgnify:CR=1 FL=1